MTPISTTMSEAMLDELAEFIDRTREALASVNYSAQSGDPTYYAQVIGAAKYYADVSAATLSRVRFYKSTGA